MNSARSIDLLTHGIMLIDMFKVKKTVTYLAQMRTHLIFRAMHLGEIET